MGRDPCQQRADLSAVEPGNLHYTARTLHWRKQMKTAFRLMLLSLLFIGAVSLINAQSAQVSHNTWTSGTPMPTARMGAAAGAIGKNIYVIDGYFVNDITGVNEVYNPKTNNWTTGASDPHPRAFVAYAVVNKKILYVFGGSDGSQILSLTESY